MSDLLIEGLELPDEPITLVLYPNGDVDHFTDDGRYETIAKANEIQSHRMKNRMKAYFLSFDTRSKVGWSYTHSLVPAMAESPQEAVGELKAIAEEKDERILTMTVYEMLETPSGGWLKEGE